MISKTAYYVSFVAFGFVAAIGSAGTNDVCHVGAQLHLFSKGSAEQSYMRHVRAFVEQGMADYVLLCAQSLTDTDRDRVVEYLAQHKVYFLVQEHYLPEKRSYDADDYARFRRIGGDYFLGVHWGELDSSGLKPEDYLPPEAGTSPTRPQVKAALAQRVSDIVSEFHQDLHVPFAHSSAVLSHGLFGESGVDVICSEIGENGPNFGMMIASNRGAARTYGKPWMIDFSTWWSPRGNAGQQVSPREGHTPWCMFSGLLDAAMGGADFVQLEVDWAAYDMQRFADLHENGLPPLLPWGQALKTLYAVTRAIGPRGTTVTPFAILLGHESGWPGVGWRVGDVRATGLFDGIRHQFMQTRDADLSLKILDIFYPGFERSAWDPEYPGCLAESPLGTLDIIQDNVPASAFNRYKVLVALGYHRATKALLAQLQEYVEQGGVLVCGDTLFLDEQEQLLAKNIDEPLIGCTVSTSDTELIELNRPIGEIDNVDGYVSADSRQEWQQHWLHPLQMTSGKVVARLGSLPYIVENRIGKGRTFFVTALNMAGNSATHRGPEPFLYANLLYSFFHNLAGFVGDGTRFTPWTGIEHIYNKRPDGSGILLVMNHGDMCYAREVSMKNPSGYKDGRVLAQGNWERWSQGGKTEFTETGDELRWGFTLEPKSFVLFEFR
jgi:hypothetical protein